MLRTPRQRMIIFSSMIISLIVVSVRESTSELAVSWLHAYYDVPSSKKLCRRILDQLSVCVGPPWFCSCLHHRLWKLELWVCSFFNYSNRVVSIWTPEELLELILHPWLDLGPGGWLDWLLSTGSSLLAKLNQSSSSDVVSSIWSYP